MNERPSLSLDQVVGVGRPKLKPLERIKILDEGGSPQEGGGHPFTLGFCGRRPCMFGPFLAEGGHDEVVPGIFFRNGISDKLT
jgi:hypothetical protein